MSDTKIDSVAIQEKAISCWFLTGATAGGKTGVSIEMARLLDAEIISLDSMAIYRGMDIGTAKPKLEIREQIPHHLIDILDPTESFSVSQYLDQASQTIDEIRERGRQVLFVGGTALYLKALLRGMFDGPTADWEFRQEIEREVIEHGGEILHQRLKMIDPVAAHLLHPNDHRRIIRAIEVFRQTGQPISHMQMQFDQGRPAEQCKVFTLRHPRPILHERIEKRVEEMFEQGIVAECETLISSFGILSHTALQAVGYREVFDYLKDESSLAETIEKTKIRTRKFARHQETWFRGLQECRLIDLDANYEPKLVAAHLVELGEALSS